MQYKHSNRNHKSKLMLDKIFHEKGRREVNCTPEWCINLHLIHHTVIDRYTVIDRIDVQVMYCLCVK